MLDQKNMHNFLSEFLPKSFVDNVRIDTNLFWNPELYSDLPCKEKLIFMCTLHTSQTEINAYINRLEKMLESGFKVGIVNYVMYEEQISRYQSFKKTISNLGLPLHPNPLWNSTLSSKLKRLKLIQRLGSQ